MCEPEEVSQQPCELGERDGSSLKSIEKYIRQSHTVEETIESDLRGTLRIAVKRALCRNFVIQDGKNFKYNYNQHSPAIKKKQESKRPFGNPGDNSFTGKRLVGPVKVV
ncbi:hypothetical protein NQ317_016105 [Molorchus minor]|uniref:H15 domain-containing protein n=1 Tax=Molorchus minor TaxID=1323400 RepID=A0ABQ9IUT8_9CUCU|nr:hypothetical protein NQ317_016105 [Molorchus minor]